MRPLVATHVTRRKAPAVIASIMSEPKRWSSACRRNDRHFWRQASYHPRGAGRLRGFVNSTRSGRFLPYMRREFLPPPSSPPKNETDAATSMSKGSAVILRTKHDPRNPLSATGLQAGRQPSPTRLHAPPPPRVSG